MNTASLHLTLVESNGTNISEQLILIQKVLESCPTYWQLIQGTPITINAADDLIQALPPGKDLQDKKVLLIFNDNRPIGIIDLVLGYPQPTVAMLGLLLIDEKFHGLGLGRKSFRALEKWIEKFQFYKKIRIGVVATNDRVLPFWRPKDFR